MGVEKEADRLFQARHVEDIRQVFHLFGFCDTGEGIERQDVAYSVCFV